MLQAFRLLVFVGLLGVILRVESQSLADAELFLASYNIPRGLAKLSVKYGTQAISVGGKISQFQNYRADNLILNTPPDVTWTRSGTYTVVMLDPDAPERDPDDGSRPGWFGPWLHAIWTDCQLSTRAGTPVVPYEPPTPGTGNHRYIFILFEQTTGGSVNIDPASQDRAAWDFEGFLAANPLLQPREINFFYVRAFGYELPPEEPRCRCHHNGHPIPTMRVLIGQVRITNILPAGGSCERIPDDGTVPYYLDCTCPCNS